MIRAAITNTEVAEKTGLSHAHISRLRRGQRKPSVATINLMKDAYGWSTSEQFEALAARRYGEAFEEMLAEGVGFHAEVGDVLQKEAPADT